MIVVLGSINADLFFSVATLPVAGETVLTPGYALRPGGKGANQAAAAARAGAETRMAGCVGADPFAELVLSALSEAGVDTQCFRIVDGVTGTAMVCVDAAGENQIVVASGANMAVTADQVPDAWLTPATTLVLQMEIPIIENERLIERARAAGCRIILNLAPAAEISETALAALDVLIVNQGEAASLAGTTREPSSHALSFSKDWACAAVVTLGANGAVFAKDGALWQIGALAVDAVDTVGAGDCFVGVLAAKLDGGFDLADAVRHASDAAALACTPVGAQNGLPTDRDIKDRIGELEPARR